MPELYSPQQQQEEPQQQMYPSIPAPMPQNPNDDFFRYRIDGLDILTEMEHQLKGEVFVTKGNESYFKQKFDRWINDEGISKVLHIIYACGINKNVFLGNLKKDEIMFKCRMLKKKLALLFFKKYQDYEIKKEMRDLLITTVVNTVHSGLSRSEEGRESDQLSTAAQRHEIFSHQEQNKEKSVWNKLPFFK